MLVPVPTSRFLPPTSTASILDCMLVPSENTVVPVIFTLSARIFTALPPDSSTEALMDAITPSFDTFNSILSAFCLIADFIVLVLVVPSGAVYVSLLATTDSMLVAV